MGTISLYREIKFSGIRVVERDGCGGVSYGGKCKGSGGGGGGGIRGRNLSERGFVR